MASKSKPVMVHIRLEKELHKQLQDEVAKNGTSLQTEITTRMQASLMLDEEQKNLIEVLKGVLKRLDPEDNQPIDHWRAHQ